MKRGRGIPTYTIRRTTVREITIVGVKIQDLYESTQNRHRSGHWFTLDCRNTDKVADMYIYVNTQLHVNIASIYMEAILIYLKKCTPAFF